MGTQTYTASPQCFCVQKRASNGGRKRATHFAYPPTDDPKMPLSLSSTHPHRPLPLLPPDVAPCSLRRLSLPLSSLRRRPSAPSAGSLFPFPPSLGRRPPAPSAGSLCSGRGEPAARCRPWRDGGRARSPARRASVGAPAAGSWCGLGGGVACPGAPFAPRASRSPASLLAGGRRDVPEGRVPSLRAGDRASIHAGDCFWGGIGGGGVARDHAEAGSCADRPEIGRFRPESPTARLCSARRGTEAGGARRSFGCAVGERTVWVCNPFFLRDPKKQIGLVFASPLLETVLAIGYRLRISVIQEDLTLSFV